MASRGRSFGTAERLVQRAVTALHTAAFQWSRGRVGASLLGNPVAVLTTTGRKSGQQRPTPLFAYPDGKDFIVVASNGGTATAPAWFLNLQAHPEATLKVAGGQYRVTAEVLSPAEKQTWWPRLTARYRGYAAYQAKTDRDIPVVRLRRVQG